MKKLFLIIILVLGLSPAWAATMFSPDLRKTNGEPGSQFAPEMRQVRVFSTFGQTSQGKKSLSGQSGTEVFIFSRKSMASRGSSWAIRLLRRALSFVGTPYAWGGTGSYGFDCSGFVMRVFAMAGLSLPRDAEAQFYQGRAVLKNQLSPGDLVFFSTYGPGPTHVGIYLGNKRFIHSSSSSGVTTSNLTDDYYRTRYLGARRY